NSNVPNLGASGAIAGVLAAYIVMFPKERVKVLMGGRIIPVNAFIVIGLWFVLQLFSGFGSLSDKAGVGGVAYFAHVGGFAAGLILTFILRGRRAPASG
ncbi:MAG TPA: rhomboid family intramembrane serine protease, partial [Pyrinomonadaceae bacterium]|nr:rhomboid family intramembrane serine protease [Pyrinomonadaceae bacterium]